MNIIPIKTKTIIPKKGKPIDGLIFSIRRVRIREFLLFVMKMQNKGARYFKVQFKFHRFRIYTVLTAFK